MKKNIKLYLAILLGIFGMLNISCNSGTNQSNSKQYNPEILNTDRIIQCYHLGGIGEDIVTGTYRAMPLGNILVSNTGRIKALQIRYADGKILWHEVTYFSVDGSNRRYRCDKTGLTFNNCADIIYVDLEAKAVGFNSNKDEKIFWN